MHTLTSKVYFSLLLNSINIVIWKVETCNMCFRVFEPVTWAPPTPTSEPSSYFKIPKLLLITLHWKMFYPGKMEVSWSNISLGDQPTEVTEKQTPGGMARMLLQQLPYNARETELHREPRPGHLQPPNKHWPLLRMDTPPPLRLLFHYLSTLRAFLSLPLKLSTYLSHSNTISTSSQVHIINTLF